MSTLRTVTMSGSLACIGLSHRRHIRATVTGGASMPSHSSFPLRPKALPAWPPAAGDLGGYKFRPGSRECFQRGKEFLAGFGVPTTLVTGNHE